MTPEAADWINPEKDPALDPWGGPMPPREALAFCDYVAPNGLPCTSRVASHPPGAHSTSDGRGWPMACRIKCIALDKDGHADWCGVCPERVIPTAKPDEPA